MTIESLDSPTYYQHLSQDWPDYSNDILGLIDMAYTRYHGVLKILKLEATGIIDLICHAQ